MAVLTVMVHLPGLACHAPAEPQARGSGRLHSCCFSSGRPAVRNAHIEIALRSALTGARQRVRFREAPPLLDHYLFVRVPWWPLASHRLADRWRLRQRNRDHPARLVDRVPRPLLAAEVALARLA